MAPQEEPAAETTLLAALEQLRLGHVAFRRVDPEELRELEDLLHDIVRELKSYPNVTEPDTELMSSSWTRSVGSLQLRLMERAFYVLHLIRYGNAPENRGWMNLFRRWGRSSGFNLFVADVLDTLTPDFRHFYEDYIRYCDLIETQPIPHPWMRRTGEKAEGVFMDSGRVHTVTRAGAGGIDDTKGQPERDQRYETPSSEGPGGTPSEPNE